MSTTILQSSKMASSQRASFLDLPLEMQSEILRLALEQQINFIGIQRRNKGPSVPGLRYPKASSTSYRICGSALSLLLINKSTSTEAARILRNLIALITDSIVNGTISQTAPPKFFELCEINRWWLDYGVFLDTIDDSFTARNHIRRLVLTPITFYDLPYWKFDQFADRMPQEFPQLREIALWVPLTQDKDKDYKASAPNLIFSLLERGIIDAVRFLFNERIQPEYDPLQNSYLSAVLSTNSLIRCSDTPGEVYFKVAGKNALLIREPEDTSSFRAQRRITEIEYGWYGWYGAKTAFRLRRTGVET
ncbi:hypothetical protein HYALB_00001421 [Hymenoscyphus albidus]|uniref:Uncharacterized protein n=1 Tax=Hymenoscyphus albidus TaxID=595503 RepID=A0A9N9L9W3_9HELO|nr:hypothetical protein HYALB_00001421 [Hymenoscyphus albidus]